MEDTVEKARASEIAELLGDFLLGADISNAYTLDKFKELFPLKFRDHEDVKLLYKAFQLKRHKMRALLKSNIAKHCSTTSMMSLHPTHNYNQPSLTSSNRESSDEEEHHLKEKIVSIRKDIKAAEKQFTRCAEQLSDFNMFQGLSEKDFQVDTLQLLGKEMEKH